jgi:branched-chain amino acid transport system substrate-binding protein
MSKLCLAIAIALALTASARAETPGIVIGISLSTTGPAASLGEPERNALEFVPKEIGGVALKMIVLDDGGDPTVAITNARRFVSESKADILVGSSIVPSSVAMSAVANEAEVPHFSLAPMPFTPAREKWSVDMPQPIDILGKVMYEHMKAHGVKTIGFLGYADSFGDIWCIDLQTETEPMGMTVISGERFGRSDTSIAGQARRLIATKPDAILIAAAGAGAGMPQMELRERGYKGLIYQTGGVASMDFIRAAGKSAEGVLLSAGPVMSPEGLPDSAPTKKPGLAFNKLYEAKYGANSRSQFAGHVYDVFEVLKRVVPVALKTAKPGTPEFREAIRQALLTEREIPASHGVYNYTLKDRYGLDERSRILLTVKNGKFVPVE